MANYFISDSPEYNPQIRQLKSTDPADATSIFNPLFQHIINNVHAVKQVADENEVVFSATRPTGNWSLWLQDLGEVPGYPEEDYPEEEIITSVVMDTAALDAPGDFVVMYDENDGETVLNMTDDFENAGEDDIIITEL